jgi:hypothetical protein
MPINTWFNQLLGSNKSSTVRELDNRYEPPPFVWVIWGMCIGIIVLVALDAAIHGWSPWQ